MEFSNSVAYQLTLRAFFAVIFSLQQYERCSRLGRRLMGLPLNTFHLFSDLHEKGGENKLF